MKKYKINNKKGKVIAEVFLYFDYRKKNEKEFIKSILKETPFINSIGYAGFINKDWFLNNLLSYKIRVPSKSIDIVEICKIIEKTLLTYSKLLRRKIYIFVFPTKDEFISKKMGGVSGITIWKNTILIYINPKIKNWRRELKETVAHESAHILGNYYGQSTLRECFVYEGIAEHFREFFVGGKRAPWTKAVTKKESILLLKKLKNKLDSKSDKLYRGVFFGTGKYPLWVGYTIGYYIVEEYLKKQKNIDWDKIIKTKPRVILKEFLLDLNEKRTN
ncbi:hypothetical protein J4449_03520 [Candidatus Woesearchaeota archaeon]|nr:hypothetical protein [Candidatus Woesearchaeota archaeon]